MHPPLGLLTVAALVPAGIEQKLIDLNIQSLKKEDIRWADMVFISAMTIQKKSVLEIIRVCKEYDVKIVAGGPLFTARHSKFPEIHHLLHL